VRRWGASARQWGRAPRRYWRTTRWAGGGGGAGVRLGSRAARRCKQKAEWGHPVPAGSFGTERWERVARCRPGAWKRRAGHGCHPRNFQAVLLKGRGRVKLAVCGAERCCCTPHGCTRPALQVAGSRQQVGCPLGSWCLFSGSCFVWGQREGKEASRASGMTVLDAGWGQGRMSAEFLLHSYIAVL
jgi:hypothetical protein